MAGGAGQQGELDRLGREVDCVLHDNGSIITSMRSNILKANLEANYEIMLRFRGNCREVIRKLDGLNVEVPQFELKLELLKADGTSWTDNIAGSTGGD